MEEMLLHTENIDEATAEVKAAGGHILLQLGRNLLVAKVPSHVAKQNSFSQASAHISSSASAETFRYAHAYWMAREDDLKPQPPVQKWTEKTAPMVLKREDSDDIFRADSPYRQTMSGKIAVMVYTVSGPGSLLAISNTEANKVYSECLRGLRFWSDAATVHGETLSFVLYDRLVQISAEDSTSCPSFDGCHNVFADPVLKFYGFSTGKAGKDQAAQKVKDYENADGAFLAFISKYKQGHFAYAISGGGPIYMQYSNDGWGPDQIDRLFAHETGHVFNAPDEYKSCDCSYIYGKGRCVAANTNCDTCTTNQAPCIMDVNDIDNLCEYTKRHVGWC